MSRAQRPPVFLVAQKCASAPFGVVDLGRMIRATDCIVRRELTELVLLQELVAFVNVREIIEHPARIDPVHRLLAFKWCAFHFFLFLAAVKAPRKPVLLRSSASARELASLICLLAQRGQEGY